MYRVQDVCGVHAEATDKVPEHPSVKCEGGRRLLGSPPCLLPSPGSCQPNSCQAVSWKLPVIRHHLSCPECRVRRWRVSWRTFKKLSSGKKAQEISGIPILLHDLTISDSNVFAE